MSKKRANGEGSIRKRKDGRWEGRYTAGYDKDGKVITKNVLGKTQAEVKEKLKAAIEESQKLDPTRTGQYTVDMGDVVVRGVYQAADPPEYEAVLPQLHGKPSLSRAG